MKGYKLWDSQNKKKVLSKDIVFDKLTISRTEANDGAKKYIVSTAIPSNLGDCKPGETA